jgi:hypothetical protein
LRKSEIRASVIQSFDGRAARGAAGSKRVTFFGSLGASLETARLAEQESLDFPSLSLIFLPPVLENASRRLEVISQAH